MLKLRQGEILLAAMRDGKHLSHIDKLKLIIALSIPSVLAQITSVMMFYIDAAMVGHLGERASASIGLVETTTWLFGSITSAASMGFAVQIAHKVGAKDFSGARNVFRHGLAATGTLGIAIAIVAAAVAFPLPALLGGSEEIRHDASLYFLVYAFALPFMQLSNLSSNALKSSGNMLVPGATSIMMCLLDVVFNYLFIYICNLGVLGAALGTLSAVVVTAFTAAYFAVFRSSILSLRHRHSQLLWNRAYIRKAVGLSTPLALQNIFMGGAAIVSTLIVAPLGNVAIAANTFAITVESLCYMPGYGIGDAASTLTGQSLGAGRIDVCKSFARMTVGIGMAVMAVMGMLMYVFAPEMLGFITPVEEIRVLGTEALRIEAFAEPMFAAAIVTACVCVGAGDTKSPMVINLCSMWIVRLSLAAVLAPRYGLPGVWFAMAVELSLRGTLYLVHLARGKWIKMKPRGI